MNRQDAKNEFQSQQIADTEALHWRFLLRVLLKAAILFMLCNLIFAAVKPLEALGSVSLYNLILPGRQRLPYGENPDQSYNLSLNNIPAMLASHVVARPKALDEFRVFIMGDSGVWGWFLPNKDTLAAQINAGGYKTPDGRRVVAYNLGYPVLSLLKDLVLLDAAMPYQPDMIVWMVTLNSFPRQKQLAPALLQNNPERTRKLIMDISSINLNIDDPRFIETDFWGNSIIGQRRALADLLRLQLYGFSWAATGIDQYIPAEITPRQSDFEADSSWQDYKEPTPLNNENMAFDVLRTGAYVANGVPILIINEPIFISTGKNSDLRYDAWYPRWAYDTYRSLLGGMAEIEGKLLHFDYLDLWDTIAPGEFSDSPVHLTARGEDQLAGLVAQAILKTHS